MRLWLSRVRPRTPSLHCRRILERRDRERR
uniref:Uncharacterized protein n=1 Tax=Arundo donax TaxID=35708 RepID=A0A0A8ZCA1_ARUDO